MRVSILKVSELNQCEQGIDSFLTPILQAKSNIFCHGHMREEGMVLEHEANPACFGGYGLTNGDLAVANAKPARLDRLKPRNQSKQRAFAAA